MLQNKADYMQDPPPARQLREVARQGYGPLSRRRSPNSTYYFFLNTRSRRSTTRGARRRSTTRIDKRALARCSAALLAPGCNFLPPGMQGYQKIDPCPYGDPNAAPDVAKAKQMIQQAGGPRAQSVTV